MPKVVRVVAASLIGITLVLSGSRPVLPAQSSTPESSPPAVISSEVLGRALPAAVDEPELALGRVTIMPGAAIPTHYHPGTQIGVVVQGELTYHVFTGEIELYWKDGSAGDPFMVRPGEMVVVRPGDTLIETPGSIHQGRNAGDVPLVIYLSTLFPVGATRSIIVDATPTP